MPGMRDAANLPGFYQPFRTLREELQRRHYLLPTKPAPPRFPALESGDEQALFRAAMREVKPLERRGAYSVPPPPPSPRVPGRPAGAELEALYQLIDLVQGRGEFDLSFTDEYLMGQVPGLDARIMAALQAGQLPVQDYCDLHGLTVAQARERLEQFLASARAKNYRTVLVIHGRGHNSPQQIPVLKQHLEHWLTSKSFRRQVLAFASARPYDGGTGALYLLLRPLDRRTKHQKPQRPH